MKKRVIYILLGVILLLACCISLLLFYILKPKTSHTFQQKKEIELPSLKIIDLDSKERSIAVMINNHNYARPYHSGLNDAYVVYELIVEGGITRLMAIFKDQTTTRIGSVRSSRHNFLDYAMEYDAIYVHYGWSNLAKNDITKYGINNINGLYDSGFWRDTTLNVPIEHTAYTNIENIKETATKKGYSLESDKTIPLNYNVFPVYLEKKEALQTTKADKVTIPYSNYMTTSYIYDETSGYYLRYANGKAHTDAITKEQFKAKNIIILKVKNYSVDSYGRQNLDTTGTGTGYYVTNGYMTKITWEKESRTSDTKYYYEDTNEEIVLNDGITYIQVEPIEKVPTFETLES